MTVQSLEADIVAALKDSKGNQRIAAEKLKVSQAWLTRWLKKHGFTRKVEWIKKTDGAA